MLFCTCSLTAPYLPAGTAHNPRTDNHCARHLDVLTAGIWGRFFFGGAFLPCRVLPLPLCASFLSDIVPCMPSSFLSCSHRSQKSQTHPPRRNPAQGAAPASAWSSGTLKHLAGSAPAFPSRCPGAGKASHPCQSCSSWLPGGHTGMDFSYPSWLRVQHTENIINYAQGAGLLQPEPPLGLFLLISLTQLPDG